jgi:hypothetical protein
MLAGYKVTGRSEPSSPSRFGEVIFSSFSSGLWFLRWNRRNRGNSKGK